MTMIATVLVAGGAGAVVLRSRRRGHATRPDAARELAALAAHISRSARAGMTASEGIRMAAPRLAGAVGHCTAELAAALERGIPMSTALGAWSDSLASGSRSDRGPFGRRRLHRAGAERLRADDVSLFVCALEVSQRWGTGLPDALDAVAVTLLDRSELHDEVRALTSQAGASTAVLCGIPVVGVLLLPVVAPQVFIDLVTTPPGMMLLGAAALLDLAALALSTRLTATVLR